MMFPMTTTSDVIVKNPITVLVGCALAGSAS